MIRIQSFFIYYFQVKKAQIFGKYRQIFQTLDPDAKIFKTLDPESHEMDKDTKQRSETLFQCCYLKLPLTVLHEQSVTVVDGIAQLEGEHRVRLQLLEASAQLGRREAVLVQSVAPGHAAQHLQVSARQPVPAAQDLLDVRVVRIGGSKLSRTSLLLHRNRKSLAPYVFLPSDL